MSKTKKDEITFIPKLLIRISQETNKFILARDAVFKINGVKYEIPMGYQWDGASIPQVFLSITKGGFQPDFLRASLLHDFMYENSLGKKLADNYFLLILKVDKVKKLRRSVFYFMVKHFGKKSYKNYLNN